MAGMFDIYKGLWQSIFGPDDIAAPTTMTPLVVNSDGSINVLSSGGGGPPESPTGYPNIATGQETVNTTAGGVEIVAARATRGDVTIVNGGTTDIWLGNSGVAIGTGVLLAGFKGAAVTIPTTAAVFGITGAGSQVVSYIESYN
jgi:hypothetical protein